MQFINVRVKTPQELENEQAGWSFLLCLVGLWPLQLFPVYVWQYLSTHQVWVIFLVLAYVALLGLEMIAVIFILSNLPSPLTIAIGAAYGAWNGWFFSESAFKSTLLNSQRQNFESVSSEFLGTIMILGAVVGVLFALVLSKVLDD
jgi:hypothetical protein